MSVELSGVLPREKTDVDPPLPDRVTAPELLRSSSENVHSFPGWCESGRPAEAVFVMNVSVGSLGLVPDGLLEMVLISITHTFYVL